MQLRDGLVFAAARILLAKGAGIVFYTGQYDPEGLKREWPDAQVLFSPVPLDILMRAVIAACGRAREANPLIAPAERAPPPRLTCGEKQHSRHPIAPETV